MKLRSRQLIANMLRQGVRAGLEALAQAGKSDDPVTRARAQSNPEEVVADTALAYLDSIFIWDEENSINSQASASLLFEIHEILARAFPAEPSGTNDPPTPSTTG